MRTYNKFITEAEGFQGKMTPGHNAAKGAITLDNKIKKTRKPGGPLAVREPGGRGVGQTKSPYKTGPLARVADKGAALVKGKNYKAPNNDEKQVGERPGTTKGDGDWGTKAKEWDRTGGETTTNDKKKNKNKNKNRLLNLAKSAIKSAVDNSVRDADSVSGQETSSAGRMQKQY